MFSPHHLLIARFRNRIYAPYVTAFDIALARLDTWSVERRTSAASHASNSTASSTPVLDASYAGAPEMSSSQRRRVKEFLRVRSIFLLLQNILLISRCLYRRPEMILDIHKFHFNRTFFYQSNVSLDIECS